MNYLAKIALTAGTISMMTLMAACSQESAQPVNESNVRGSSTEPVNFDSYTTSTLTVTGMTCVSCERSVRDLLAQHTDGIAWAEANHEKNQVVFFHDPKVTPDDVVKRINEVTLFEASRSSE